MYKKLLTVMGLWEKSPEAGPSTPLQETTRTWINWCLECPLVVCKCLMVEWNWKNWDWLCVNIFAWLVFFYHRDHFNLPARPSFRSQHRVHLFLPAAFGRQGNTHKNENAHRGVVEQSWSAGPLQNTSTNPFVSPTGLTWICARACT